jgi:hypothetical protein
MWFFWRLAHTSFPPEIQQHGWEERASLTLIYQLHAAQGIVYTKKSNHHESLSHTAHTGIAPSTETQKHG